MVLNERFYLITDKILIARSACSTTYYLGQRREFNNQLNETKKWFTYFAPRDYAWNVAEVTYPSTLKKLFMPGFSYHVSVINETKEDSLDSNRQGSHWQDKHRTCLSLTR